MIDWSFLVNKATARRKALGYSQERLAALCELTPPTISRFENLHKDIKVSTALRIFLELGLTEKKPSKS